MKNIAIAGVALATLTACQTTVQQPAKVLYPVERCGYVEEPVYGVLDRPTSDGEVLGGAVIGGVIGNQLSDKTPLGTVVGAIVGGAIVNGQRVQEGVVVGTNRVYRCQTVYE
jgi:uncharacterized protein YcfJ